MITFCLSTLFLILAYFGYGWYLDRMLGIDPNRPVPALAKNDGVDFVPLPWTKVFLIQLLNIAGLGPIFGAVAGALWGPVVFLWIVFGGIFIGAVHDYVSAFISLREGGASLTEIVGKYLGPIPKHLMVLLVMVLLVMVGAVFVMGPAQILADLNATVASTSGPAAGNPVTPGLLAQPLLWSVIIFVYYLLATLLPIDKLIGRIYPVFGGALILMVVLIMGKMFTGDLTIPELSLANLHPDGVPIWPIMMVTVACGAISGFHATQSPMMARTISNERFARRVFFGAMLCETFIALVWAGAAMAVCHGSSVELKALLGPKSNAVVVVRAIADTLGSWGMILVLLGVVALPISTGDTAFRSARLIMAELADLPQKPIKNRLILSVPLFIVGGWLCTINFGVVWRYFAWINQTLSVFTLWAATVYLWQLRKNYWLTLIPALFMSLVSSSFILLNTTFGFGLQPLPSGIIAGMFALSCLWLTWKRSRIQETISAPARAAAEGPNKPT